MSDRIVTVGYIGNGKSANRYHAPFVLARPEKFRIKAMQARHVSHEARSPLPRPCTTPWPSARSRPAST